ncbi:hypothetical protein NM688_g2341 [Phlebia brevispora]|uniref:Uncharacterized protein n=1 Tax=Phlebia brevispora TaxID=194682 RepID=A0ACC1T960_9APHY|nr:hypothetical protein NM688_g2341 [Phlebia brevispora]
MCDIIQCLIGCIVQTFFTARLYVLMSRKTRYTMIPIIALFVVAHLETSAWGYETRVLFWNNILIPFPPRSSLRFRFVVKSFARLRDKIWMSALPFAIFAVASDIIIAGSLCVVLNKSKSYLMTTNNLINHLMIFAINRCLLTAVVAVVEVILFAVFPNKLWYLSLDFVVGKLYANSLLATLNTRFSIRARGGSSSDESNVSRSDPDGVPSLRLASGVDNRAPAVFSTVIQPMTSSTMDEESILSDHHSEDDRSKATPKSRPITPMSTGDYELGVLR